MGENKLREIMTRDVRIEWLAMGALAHRQGDGVLSCSAGVSDMASRYCALMADGSPADYASFYVLRHPRLTWATLLHVQGDFMRFGGGVRNYSTRIAYECGDEQIEAAGGYAALLGALDAMHVYEQADFAASNVFRVMEPPPSPLSSAEQVLCGALAYALTHGRRLWIRLGKEERRYADELRQSVRLRSLLSVLDHLPAPWRRQVSMAFSVDGRTPGTLSLLPDVQVVAFHGEIADFGSVAQDGIVVDWTAPQPNVELADLQPWTVELERLAAVSPAEPSQEPSGQATESDDTSEASSNMWKIIVPVLAVLALLAYYILRQ